MDKSKKIIHWRSKITDQTGQGSVAIADADEICDRLNRQHPDLEHWTE